jgi:hypothetical protein
MARAIPEAVLTGTLEVSPRPPWLVQCLQDVEVLVQVECLFYGLAKAESVQPERAPADDVVQVIVTSQSRLNVAVRQIEILPAAARSAAFISM